MLAGRRIGWLRSATFLALGFVFLFLRRPETLTRAEFYTEDGQVFFVGTFFDDPLSRLARAYNGSIHLASRLIAEASRLVPIDLAPLVANALALLVVASVATFLASDRLADVVPDRRVRVAIGGLFLALPGGQEPLGSMTYVQFYLAVFLVFGALMGSPRNLLEAVGERIAIAVAALTGPFGVLLSPLFLGRLWVRRDRASGSLVAIVMLGAAAQVTAFVLVSNRTEGTLSSPLDVLTVWAGRSLGGALLGQFWTAVVIALGPPIEAVVLGVGVIAAAVALLISGLPRAVLLALVYAHFVIVAAGLGYHPEPIRFLLDNAYFEGRYFLVPNALIALALVIAVPTWRPAHRRIGAIVLGLLVLGVLGDLRLIARPAHDWAARNDCIGGQSPCEVPVEPPYVWTIRWPGAGGIYDQDPLPAARSSD